MEGMVRPAEPWMHGTGFDGNRQRKPIMWDIMLCKALVGAGACGFQEQRVGEKQIIMDQCVLKRKGGGCFFLCAPFFEN